MRYAGLRAAVLLPRWLQLLVAALAGQHVVRQAANLPHAETSLARFRALEGQESERAVGVVSKQLTFML